MSHTAEGRIEEAVQAADTMLSVTAGDTISYSRLAALACAGQAYLAADRYEAAGSLLDSAAGMWNSRKQDQDFTEGQDLTPVLALYNSIGVFSISHELDYEKATEAFIEGLELSRARGHAFGYAIMSYNLIMTYNIRKDPEGLKYAKEVYEKGIEDSNEKLIYMGEYGMALMYYLKGDYNLAKKYILMALDSPVKTNNALVCCIYATILSAEGRAGEAEIYYSKAIKEVIPAESTTASFVFLSYGKFLLRQNKPAAAASILGRGIKAAGEKGNKVFLYQLYESLSEAYAGIGEYDEALGCYRKFHSLSDSIFNIRKERNINELAIKYETALRDSEIQEKNLELMKKNHALALSIILIFIVLSVSAFTLVLYRNKNRMYTRIARQYQDSIIKSRNLEEIIASYRKREESATARPESGIDKDKSMEIISKFEDLMQNQKIYRDNTLSRDRIAELIGTNRTYLSKVLNEQYGKSVNQLINSYRISRAIELLGMPENNMPMKAVEQEAGFSSSSNFFMLFKEQVGMSPAKFREKILEISREKKASENMG